MPKKDQSRLGYCSVLRAPIQSLFSRRPQLLFKDQVARTAECFVLPTPHSHLPILLLLQATFYPPPSHSHPIHLLIPFLSGRGPISEVKKKMGWKEKNLGCHRQKRIPSELTMSIPPQSWGWGSTDWVLL